MSTTVLSGSGSGGPTGSATNPTPNSSGPHCLPTVPRLPDPRIPPDLWQQLNPSISGNQITVPSLESIASLAALGSDPLDYPLADPLKFGLPPLPPIPTPPLSTRVPRTQIAPSARPILNPPIPPSSPLSSVNPRDTEACVDAFNEENAQAGPSGTSPSDESDPNISETEKGSKSTSAQVKFGGKQVLVSLPAAWVWIGVGEKGKVGIVRVHLGVRSTPPPVHALPHLVASAILSTHLTSLHLTLASLLYRIPRIIPLVDSPCLTCGQRLSPREGLAVGGTGWLPGESDKPFNDWLSTKEGEEEKKSGRWVSWHTSCNPSL